MSERILLSHGGGGRATRELIDREMKSRFSLGTLPDAATLAIAGGKVAFTTDSFVVSPAEFPGGDIGKLAVCGTVNDLAVSGAKPMYLACSLILEEGLEVALLRRVLDSLAGTARSCGVSVVTGDTKVVPRGQCDRIYITTTGIGEPMPGFDLGSRQIQAGDEIVVSGPLGEHGLAILAAREGAPVGEPLLSDCAPVNRLVESLKDIAPDIRFMRDPTRGGLAMVCHEVIEGTSCGVELRESLIPSNPKSAAFAEMTGIDVLHLASEGRVVLVCRGGIGDVVVSRWREIPEGTHAAKIGVVTAQTGRVAMRTLSGGTRLIDIPEGELLPRIC